MKKILTISIAAYNSEKYLVKCLDSLINCSELDKLEILVINDGSTDSTRQIAEVYQEKYPYSVKVINKENGGHGSTINASIKLATGKYYKLVDADDSVDSEGLDKLVRFLEDTTADLVLNSYVTVNMSGKITKTISCIKGRIEYGKEYKLVEIQNAINHLMHTATFRTEIVKQIGKPITEHCYYVDNEYVMYPIPYVKTVVALDYVIYRYLNGTPEQSVNIQNLIKRRDQRLHIIKKLLGFYHLCDKDTNGYDLINNRLVVLIIGQYEIYFSMKDLGAGKEEAIQFDNYLKEQCPDLYSDVLNQEYGKFVLFIRLMRRTNFHGYGFAVNVWNNIRTMHRSKSEA